MADSSDYPPTPNSESSYSEPTSEEFHVRSLIRQFAVNWTDDSPAAEEYWRSQPEFDGSLEILCELLAHEHRLRLRSIAKEDVESRKRLLDSFQIRLRAITEDEAVWNCLRSEIDQLIGFDDIDDGVIGPPNVGVSVSSLDSYLVKGRVEGSNAGEQAHLGKGGFKAVLLANQQNLSRDVVLKFPIDGLSVYHVGIEARILKRLSHQNIPPVHEFRERHPNYGSFIVETFVGRETWGDVIRRERDRILNIENLMTRRTEWDRVLEQHIRILHTVCQPVRYAHEVHGLVHIDLKPGNVMIRQPAGKNLDVNTQYDFRTAEVFVIDWGEGVFTREVEDSEGLEGRLIRNRPRVSGTPGYRPPELEPIAGVGIDLDRIKNWYAIDVYSLGVILLQLFTGRPIQTVTRGGTNLVAAEIPQKLKDAGWKPAPELLVIQQKAMSSVPEERYQSVAEFMTAIERFLSNMTAAREIDVAVLVQQEWAGRIAQRNDQSAPNRRAAKESLRSLVEQGNAIAQRFLLATHQILGEGLKPESTIPPELPAITTAIRQLREIWQFNLVLTREMGEYQQSHLMLDRLASLPSTAMDDVNRHRREIERLDRRRELTLRAFWASAFVAVFLAAFAVNSEIRSRQAEVDRKDLELANIELVSKNNEETQKRENAVKLQNLAEANQERMSKSQPFELLSQRAGEWRATNATSRLMAEVVSIRDVDLASRMILRDKLGDTLLPTFVARMFNDQLPDEHQEGEGLFGNKFRFALSINTLSRNSATLVGAGVPKTSRLRAWNLDTFRPIESFNKTAWELPIDDNSLIGGLALSPDEKRLAVGLQSGEIRILDVATGKMLVKTQGHQTNAVLKDLFKSAVKDFPYMEIGRLIWSPGGSRIASHAYLGDSIRIWDASTLDKQFEFPNLDVVHGEAYSPPEFCGDGRYLTAVRNRAKDKNKQSLLVMDLDGKEQTGRKPGDIKEFSTFVSSALSVAATFDGKLLAVGGTNAIEIWDTPKERDNWTPLRVISTRFPTSEWMKGKAEGLPSAVRTQLKISDDLTVAMSFSRDRRLLAITRGDGTLAVLNVASGQVLWIGMGLPSAMAYDANSFPHFTATGDLFTIGTDGRLLSWELGGRRLFPAEELEKSAASINVVGSDGRFFKNVGRKALTWYEPDDPRHPLKSKLRDDDVRLLHRSQTEFPDDVVRVLTSLQKNSAIAALAKGGMAIVDLETGKPRVYGSDVSFFSLPGTTAKRTHFALAVSTDGAFAAANNAKGGILVVEIGSAKAKATLGKSSVVSLAFRPNRPDELVATTTRGGVEVWSIDQTDKPIRTLIDDLLPGTVNNASDAGQVCYSPDGEQLIVAQGPMIRLYDANSKVLIQEWKGHDSVPFAGQRVVMVNALAFRNDGLRLTSLAADGKVRIWDRTTLKSEFYPAGTIPLTNLQSFQISSELAEYDDEDTVRENQTISDLVSLRFLDQNRLFVDTNYCTARVYDLSRLNDFYTKPAQEIISFTEGMTGLTIVNPNVKLINGRVEPKDIRVEFSPTVHRPEPLESYEPRLDKGLMMKAIFLRDALRKQGDFQGAEAAISDFITRNPQSIQHPDIQYLLQRRALDRATQKKFAEALEDCKQFLKGFNGWPLNPVDDLAVDANLPDGRPVSLFTAVVLHYQEDIFMSTKQFAEAQKAAISVAAWARRTLGAPKSHLLSKQDRVDVMNLLRESTETAERLLNDQGKADDAAIVRKKANQFLKKN